MTLVRFYWIMHDLQLGAEQASCCSIYAGRGRELSDPESCRVLGGKDRRGPHVFSFHPQAEAFVCAPREDRVKQFALNPFSLMFHLSVEAACRLKARTQHLVRRVFHLYRSFLPVRPAPRKISDFAVTQTPGKTFAVLAGFCHSVVMPRPTF